MPYASPAGLSFDENLRSFLVQTNNNADCITDYVIEVAATDAGSLTTDSADLPSFRITIIPFPVVLVPPTDLNDILYALNDPTAYMTFSPFSTTYLGPTSITYSAVIIAPISEALEEIGCNLISATRIFSVFTLDDADLGDFTIQVTATESINAVSQTATFLVTIYVEYLS